MFRSLLRALERTKYRLNSKDGLVKKRIGDHVMCLDTRDRGLSSYLLRLKPDSPEREPAFMKVLRQELRQGMAALDIGANIGYTTLAMAKLAGPSGKVYAFEPEPRNFELLRKNIEANKYSSFVYPLQLGISNYSGVTRFYVSNHSNLCGMAPAKHSKYTINVRVITVDDFMKDKECPDFIKMDIEGHEVEAIEGMYSTLNSATAPVKLLLEVHQKYYSAKHDLEKQLRRLLASGFTTKYVISAAVARPDFFMERGYEPVEVFQTGKWSRGIYTDVSDEHMLQVACHECRQSVEHKKLHINRVVRAIMMEKAR
jgi:FkbM family methyltransferase